MFINSYNNSPGSEQHRHVQALAEAKHTYFYKLRTATPTVALCQVSSHIQTPGKSI
jgi:hypothetical protein